MDNQDLPMFYKSPRPLDREVDGNSRVSRPKNYNFAAHTNAIPLLVDEFPMAASHYPIVFADGPSPIPAVVVGLRNDINQFVDPRTGQWQPNSYLPAYVRRYPFILMDDADRKQFVLCVDDGAEMIGPEGEFPLFEGEKPSSFTKGAMDFCAALRQQGDATDAFVKELKDLNLLMPNDAQIEMPDKTRLQLSGFLVINPKKFDALPDNVYLEWRRKGWIGLIYAHLLSSFRWQNLVAMAQE